MQGGHGCVPGKVERWGSSWPLRKTLRTLAAGGHRVALSRDHGNGVLTMISGSQVGPVWSGRQPAGRVTAATHTVGGHPTGSSADAGSTRNG